MSSIGSFVAGTTTTLSLNFIPETIEIADSASAVTSLIVETTDYGTILNLDANGFLQMGNLESFGAVAATRKFALATGQIPISGQSCRITATLGAGADREVFQRSERAATPDSAAIIRTSIAQALNNSEIAFDKFSYLGLGNVGATDIINILYENGHVESAVHPYQLQQMLVEKMGGVAVPTLAGVVSPSVLDNTDGTIKRVTLIPRGGNVNVYLRRLQSISAITMK